MVEVIGKFKELLNHLQNYIDNMENPFNQLIIINKNKVDPKYMKNIDFKNVNHIYTPNLPNDVAFCVVDKDKFDKFDIWS